MQVLNKISLEPDNPTVDANVEHICGLGCTRVNEIIDALENGSDCEELADTSSAHRAEVLIELKAIMAVYDADDSEQE